MNNSIASVLTIVFLCLLTSSFGQNIADLFADDHDTNYIESYKHQLTTRLYSSRKYTGLKIRNIEKDATLNYNPNDRIILGFGATYNAFTLNIGINFPFVNHDDEKYGKTDYLDLQSHLLFRKITIEFYYSTYKGYYISNPDEILIDPEDSDNYPQRRDMLTSDLGATVYYIFNHRKFSYRAAFNQDERQKKSAGSFLAGPAIFTTYFQGDSSIIPYNIKPPDFFENVQLKRSRYANVCVSAGYAYNLVFFRNFFMMASLIAGPGMGWAKIYTEEDDIEGLKNFALALTYTFRAGVGYNNKRMYFGLGYVNTNASTQTPVQNTNYIFKRGNIRINIAYRLPL